MPKMLKVKENGIVYSAPLYGLVRQQNYNVDDIAYCKTLPSYLRLKCVTAGTTGENEIDLTGVAEGTTVMDGTAEFIVIKDGSGGGCNCEYPLHLDAKGIYVEMDIEEENENE